MGIFFVYILKSSVCLALFYLFYRLLLSKETFHRFNRFALLGVLVLSCCIPFLEVTTNDTSDIAHPFLSLEEMLMMTDAESVGTLEETATSFPWRALLLLVYMAGILFFVLRHLWSLGRMLRLLRTSQKENLGNGVTLFVHDHKEIAPFSWMKNIAMSATDLEDGRDAVLMHERAHIHNLHSWDLLLAEVCIFLQWFNPAAWLLKQELQTVHEYEADEWVINNGIDARNYQLLLIKKAVGSRLYSIANSFNHSSLNKRITMMIKKKSNPWARMKYLYVLPLATVAVAAFARPEVSNELNEISSAKVNELASIVKTEEVKSVENPSNKKFKLTGQVRARETKLPVPGVSVIIRNTSTGAMTDMNGKFELQVEKGDVLIFSYVGLQTTQILVKDETNPDETKLVVWMQDDVQQLEEMTVVGYAPQEDETKKVKNEQAETPKADQQEKVIFRVVEEMPEFPGGMGEAMKFLARNMKYPVKAQEAGIQGRVIVQFVVDTDGSISDIEIARGVCPELDAEAKRVIGLMPKWKPGKQRGRAVAVKFTMPIMFQLQKPAPKQEVPVVDLNTIAAPLVVIDGKVMGRSNDISSMISPDQIENVSVLKNKDIAKQYGDDAKYGVIVINTKKGNKAK